MDMMSQSFDTSRIRTPDLPELESRCVRRLHEIVPPGDPSHDVPHTLRVLAMAKHLGRLEGADLMVVVPAAIFHDAVTYRKDDPRNAGAVDESATLAHRFLLSIGCAPAHADKVAEAVSTCSYSRGIRPRTLEGMVVKDADLMEQSGAISIMRTFASCGQLSRPLMDFEDPFCDMRAPDPRAFGLDLLPARLLKVGEHVSTVSAKKILENREAFLRKFLSQLKEEVDLALLPGW
jgi:uncharacterized protein